MKRFIKSTTATLGLLAVLAFGATGTGVDTEAGAWLEYQMSDVIVTWWAGPARLNPTCDLPVQLHDRSVVGWGAPNLPFRYLRIASHSASSPVELTSGVTTITAPPNGVAQQQAARKPPISRAAVGAARTSTGKSRRVASSAAAGGHSVRMEIRELSGGDEDAVLAISHLLDGPAAVSATRRFLTDHSHHVLVAYDHGTAAGFVTGVEMTHPDKGTEMFLYELGVDERFRGRGIGKALVVAMVDLARAVGCYGMWVLADEGNAAAMRTYQAAGGTDVQQQTMLSWRFADT